MGSLVDGIDQFIDALAPVRFNDVWFFAVPVAVGYILRNLQDRLSATSS